MAIPPIHQGILLSGEEEKSIRWMENRWMVSSPYWSLVNGNFSELDVWLISSYKDLQIILLLLWLPNKLSNFFPAHGTPSLNPEMGPSSRASMDNDRDPLRPLSDISTTFLTTSDSANAIKSCWFLVDWYWSQTRDRIGKWERRNEMKVEIDEMEKWMRKLNRKRETEREEN